MQKPNCQLCAVCFLFVSDVLLGLLLPCPVISLHPTPALTGRRLPWLCATFPHTHIHQLKWACLTEIADPSSAYVKLSNQNVYHKTTARPAVCAGQLEQAAGCSPVGLGQPEQPLTRIQPPPTPKLAQPRRSGPAVLGWEEEGQASPHPCDGTPTQKAFGYRAELTCQASQDPSLLWAAARHALAGLVPGLSISPGCAGSKHLISFALRPPPLLQALLSRTAPEETQE